jgi:uncharacterized metal-binding protein
MANECACMGAPTLIFSCSGAADVGEVADRAARMLTKEGLGRMYCLAGIGGRVSGIVKTTEAADRILVIDGCPLDCAKNSLDQAGIGRYNHLQLADLGLAKGQSPANDENISRAAGRAREMLGSGCLGMALPSVKA